MKEQKFYPRQVLRKLHGDHHDLDRGQLAAIRYATLNGRRLGFRLWINAAVDVKQLAAAGSTQLAEITLANTTTRIVLKEPY